MKRIIKEKQKWIPFALLFLMWLVVFAFIRPGFGDDIKLRDKVLSEGAYSAWLYFQTNWSSRFIIEALYLPIYKMPHYYWVFRVANSAMFTLMGYCLFQFAAWDKSRTAQYAVILSTFFFPLYILSTAGWLATTATYLWPLSCGMYAALPVVKSLQGRKVNKHYCITSPLAMMLACNEELVCAMMVGLFCCIVCFSKIKKLKITKLTYVLFVIAVLMLGYTMFCGGNANRRLVEINTWYPIFYAQSITERMMDSFLATALYLLSPENVLLQAMCLGLAFVIWQKYEEPLIRIVGSIPAVYFFAFGALQDITLKIFPAFEQLYVGTLDEMALYNPDIIISCSITLFIYLLIAIDMIFAMSNRSVGYLMAILWMGGASNSFCHGIVPHTICI